MRNFAGVAPLEGHPIPHRCQVECLFSPVQASAKPGTVHQALFTYLTRDGVEATNWRAEQAIRPAVVNRKVWGGNRTSAGAHTQQVLASVLRTCQQQARDPTLAKHISGSTPDIASRTWDWVVPGMPQDGYPTRTGCSSSSTI
ncbi:MAG: transposase [Chloroflexota bacterium]|nr:transposase [Chloroflexota bacterium]